MQIASLRRIEPIRHSTTRAGFTLLELMIVVVIIAILLGLLLPAISSVRRAARDAEVRKDISDLEQAITQFKVSFGVEPPSSITLYANPPHPTVTPNWDNDPSDPVGCKRSKGLIRQLWAKFDFSNCGGMSDGNQFSLPSGATDKIVLNGAECLMFFLGGIIDVQYNTATMQWDRGSGGLIGFAKDPAHPFFGSAVTNREGPFFEFKGALKVPIPDPANAKNPANWARRVIDDAGANWFPEYRDPFPQQTKPYVYFNGASGAYRTAGMPWQNTDGQPYLSYAYYSKIDPVNSRASVPYKPKGFQIISPGPDAVYGTGGLFDPNNTSGLSKDDRDNITNFHSGRLGG